MENTPVQTIFCGDYPWVHYFYVPWLIMKSQKGMAWNKIHTCCMYVRTFQLPTVLYLTLQLKTNEISLEIKNGKPNLIRCYTQRNVQPDQCYFTVQINGINFECSLYCNSTVIVYIALLLHIIWWEIWL